MTRREILEEAVACVCGQREQDYGSPENNFKLISELWSDYLSSQISPVDVAMMMAMLKIARIKSGKSTADSFVDLAGYAACGGEIATNAKKVESEKTEREKQTSQNLEKLKKAYEKALHDPEHPFPSVFFERIFCEETHSCGENCKGDCECKKQK